MGVYLSKAKTEKDSASGGDAESTGTFYGLTSMQGWRQSMEDAHLALPLVEDLKEVIGRDVAVYGVFDGHGGPAVSAWIARHLIPVLTREVKELQPKLPELAAEVGPEIKEEWVLLSESMCKAFVQLDEEMQTPEHLEEIKVIHCALQALSDADAAEESADGAEVGDGQLRNLITSQPRSIWQAFLGTAHGAKPQIKLVEQNGEQYFQITTGEQEEEDNNVITAPPAKNPAAITTDELETPAEPNKLASEVEEERGSEIRAGLPETCGAAVVVCAVVDGPQPFLVTANAGDSRCVLCRDGVAVAQSHDHKPYLFHEMERIRNAGGTVEHGRVDGNLNLSRTLGDLFYKRNKDLKAEEQKITAYPDIIITPLTPQDEFIILACDGIWDCMSNQEACDFVKSRLTPNPTPDDLRAICEQMCDSCLAGHPLESDNGIGCDNMTCIIVMLNEAFRKRGVQGEAPSRYYKQPH